VGRFTPASCKQACMSNPDCLAYPDQSEPAGNQPFAYGMNSYPMRSQGANSKDSLDQRKLHCNMERRIDEIVMD